MRPKALKRIFTLFAAIALWAHLEGAYGVEFEPLGKAVGSLLGTTKAARKVVGESTIFYSKDGAKIHKVAVIEKGVYQPDCTHTWAIGIDPVKGTVTDIHTIEMKCQHAFPCKAASFLDQYKGKGPADVAKLDSQVTTIAKATGTANLTTAAVKRAITDYAKAKGSL